MTKEEGGERVNSFRDTRRQQHNQQQRTTPIYSTAALLFRAALMELRDGRHLRHVSYYKFTCPNDVRLAN